MIAFTKRPKIKQTPTGRQRSFVSEDGRYRIVEIYSLAGHWWLAVRRLACGEYPISRHRKRRPAERACDSHRKA